MIEQAIELTPEQAEIVEAAIRMAAQHSPMAQAVIGMAAAQAGHRTTGFVRLTGTTLVIELPDNG